MPRHFPKLGSKLRFRWKLKPAMISFVFFRTHWKILIASYTLYKKDNLKTLFGTNLNPIFTQNYSRPLFGAWILCKIADGNSWFRRMRYWCPVFKMFIQWRVQRLVQFTRRVKNTNSAAFWNFGRKRRNFLPAKWYVRFNSWRPWLLILQYAKLDVMMTFWILFFTKITCICEVY